MVWVDWKWRWSKRLPVFGMCQEVSLSWLKWSTITASFHSLNGTVTCSRTLSSIGNTHKLPYDSLPYDSLVQTQLPFLVPDWSAFMKAAEYDKQSCLGPKSTLECLGSLIPSQTAHIWRLSLLITCNPLQGLTTAPVKAGYAKLGSATCPLLRLTGVFMPSLTSDLGCLLSGCQSLNVMHCFL